MNQPWVTPYATFLASQLDGLAATPLPANNAQSFQTVDVLLTGANQTITPLFNFSGGVDGYGGRQQLPIAFVASVIDPANGNLPLGSVTAPIYLQYQPNLVTVTIDAESVTTTSVYRLENNAVASGGKLLSLLNGAAGKTGTASFAFTGGTGLYNVILGTFDESDGVSSFSLSRSGVALGSVSLNQNLPVPVQRAGNPAAPILSR